MLRIISNLSILAMLPLLSGCVAALIPLAAAGALGKGELDRSKARKEIVVAGAVSVEEESAAVQAQTSPLAIPAPTNAKPLSEAAKAGGFSEGEELEISSGQLSPEIRGYLARVYRSMRPGDGPPYEAFTRYALAQASRIKPDDGQAQIPEGAVLIPRVDMTRPEKISCAGKPLAVMIDLDTPDMAAWSRSETLYRQDGLAESLEKLRAADITVIWLSDLPAANSFEISSILKDAQLAGTGESDDFLFLNRGGRDRKQARRWDAARSYCILAAAGDKRSDFDELYDYLRNPDGAITLENMFGNGWFIAPPPLVTPPADIGAG